MANVGRPGNGVAMPRARHPSALYANWGDASSCQRVKQCIPTSCLHHHLSQARLLPAATVPLKQRNTHSPGCCPAAGGQWWYDWATEGLAMQPQAYRPLLAPGPALYPGMPVHSPPPAMMVWLPGRPAACPPPLRHGAMQPMPLMPTSWGHAGERGAPLCAAARSMLPPN